MNKIMAISLFLLTAVFADLSAQNVPSSNSADLVGVAYAARPGLHLQAWDQRSGWTHIPPGRQTMAFQAIDLENEAFLGIGAGSVPYFGIYLGFVLTNSIGKAFVEAIDEERGGMGVTFEENINGSGAFTLGYNRYLSPRLYVGGQLVYERVTDRLDFSNGNVGRYHVSVWTIMARAGFNWVNNPSFQFYSNVALGVSVLTYKEPTGLLSAATTSFAGFQITPVGLRFGRNIGVFMELGLGWSGLAAVGISHRF